MNYEMIDAEILHNLKPDCSFITLREPCNNQRPRCDIASRSIASPFNSKNRRINITYFNVYNRHFKEDFLT